MKIFPHTPVLMKELMSFLKMKITNSNTFVRWVSSCNKMSTKIVKNCTLLSFDKHIHSRKRTLQLAQKNPQRSKQKTNYVVGMVGVRGQCVDWYIDEKIRIFKNIVNGKREYRRQILSESILYWLSCF